MLACTNEEFNKKVEAIVERCQRFEAGLLEGDLSDSQANDDPVETMKLSENEST